jgi:hypothetical protein
MLYEKGPVRLTEAQSPARTALREATSSSHTKVVSRSLSVTITLPLGAGASALRFAQEKASSADGV